MGGKSEEREVSLSTGRMILHALDVEKYNAFPVDTGCLNVKVLESTISYLPEPSPSSSGIVKDSKDIVSNDAPGVRPDVAFIALHGRFGEDGTIQGLLELLDIPYVGSGVLASALAMDKIMTRKLLLAEGVLIPDGIVFHKGMDVSELAKNVADELGYPVVVKPNQQGSTIGLSIVKNQNDLSAAVELALKYDKDVLLEEYIEGIEITAPVIGNDELEALPVIEIVPEGGFYDYHAKYTPGATEEIVPARIPIELYNRAQALAIQCHKALGCRGMSRTDMMVSGEDIYVLEINTIPGMTPTSLMPRSAQSAGIEFPELLDRLIGHALER